MKAIWKFVLEQTDQHELQLSAGAQILSVAEQGGELMMWVMVDPEVPLLEPRVIHILGTGHQHPNGTFGLYVGTVPMTSGLVWHVFQETKA